MSYKKPLPAAPPAPPANSFSGNASGPVSTSGPDTPRNPADKSDFEIVVEGVPAKLWEEQDEESLKCLLEEWVPSTHGEFASADGDEVLEIKRAGNSARCKIHTSLYSRFRFHFSFRLRVETCYEARNLFLSKLANNNFEPLLSRVQRAIIALCI